MTDQATLSLATDVKPLCSLALHVRRVTDSVVGRPLELAAVEETLRSARTSLAGLTLEGEPGIGKTRLLLAAGEIATTDGFLTVAVMADEEIRGPFLLARSIFASAEAQHGARGTAAEEPLQRALQAVSGRDDPALAALPPDQKLLRAFDLASLAIRALSSLQPLAIFVDDLQWADEDSLRLLRYVIRTETASPVFLMVAMRPEETAQVNEAVTLIADMERMGLVRRLRPGRFSQTETAEFLRHVLGGPVHPSSAAAMHAQAEGVPFVVEELAHAYRDSGMVQVIDGVWTLARNADRLVPSAVRTLIQRRAARLPDDAREALGEAAVLGRTFSLRDLREVKRRLGEDDDPQVLAGALAPAVTAGLLIEHPPSSPADYSFTHEQVREFASAGLSAPRRRSIHGAVVDMLLASGEPPAGSLPLVAHHALLAGDSERAAQLSLAAAREALESHAPEEALRLVDLALPMISAAADRFALLCVRDAALDMSRRPDDRLERLAELAALAEAMGDPGVEADVALRRSAALRASGDHERAAELARRVAESAKGRDDQAAELAAQLALGQALMQSELGETYTPNPTEADFEGSHDAFARALELAQELGDRAAIAAAERELGVLAAGRVRAWFVERVAAGEHIPILRRIVSGEKLEEMAPGLPIFPDMMEAFDRLPRAAKIFEELGDRRGLMSTIIALAYISWGPDVHMPGSPKRIEEIRRLATEMTAMTKATERELAEAQMLYGVHVYSRAKGFPDLAISRGRDAYQAARSLGDRGLEFSAAGGVALAYADVGDADSAQEWLDRAASVAAGAPTPRRARQMALWRGLTLVAAYDPALRAHLDVAAQLASDQGRIAARCEARAWLATGAALLGARTEDAALLEVAEAAANEAKTLTTGLPGRTTWSAQADAALATVALARGHVGSAVTAGRAALAALDEAMTEDANLHIVLPAARAILAGGEDEEVQGRLRLILDAIAQRFMDDAIRVQWFRGPWGSELVALAGPPSEPATHGEDEAGPLDAEGARLMTLVVEGKSNAEIAGILDVTEDVVATRLAALFASIGANSRADATAFALMGRMI